MGRPALSVVHRNYSDELKSHSDKGGQENRSENAEEESATLLAALFSWNIIGSDDEDEKRNPEKREEDLAVVVTMCGSSNADPRRDRLDSIRTEKAA
jgi:hypothetical protein